MDPKVAIVSARTREVAPSQNCVIECEDVMAAALSATIVPIFEPALDPRDGTGFDILVFVAISHWQLSRMISAATELRRRSGSCYAYVFDSFYHYLADWTDRFPGPLRPVARLARHELRNLQKLERIFAPTGLTIDEQEDFFGVPFTYVPIGVDAVKFGSAGQNRHIDVNGYGRQPPALSNYFSDAMNSRESDFFYHFTGHQRHAAVIDPMRHRKHFWKLLSRSKVALAYAPEAYDPHGRFDCSFVGQRWFESIAAGCVVVGRRPSAPDCIALFNWTDALIDLPEEPREAFDAVLRLLDDPERLARCSQRNHREALKQHDWRHRIADMAPLMDLKTERLVIDELVDADI